MVGDLNKSVQLFNQLLDTNYNKNERLAIASGEPKESFDMDRWHMDGLHIKEYFMTMTEDEYDRKLSEEARKRYEERNSRQNKEEVKNVKEDLFYNYNNNTFILYGICR